MYINGHIYRIVCLIEPKIQYVGSTFNELRHRWQYHKIHYKKYLKETYDEIAIYPYFKQYGIENFKIIKIKDYIVYAENKKDHKHLSAYEQLWINKLKCVNKTSAFNPLKNNKRYHAFECAISHLKKRANETEEEKKERLRKNRESQSKRQANIRANETEEQKKERLQKERDRSTARRAKQKAEETEEEKKERQRKETERQAIYRAKKKAEKEAQKNLMANSELKII